MTNDSESSRTPYILPREQHPISRKQFTPGTLDVLYRLREAGYRAYIAGGGVRDLLVGRAPKDFDVATNARPEQVKRLFRHCRLVGRRFRLAHVHLRDEVIEVSTFRANLEDRQEKSHFHEKSDDGQVLRDNIYGTPEQDAWRRDFTVNALFYNIEDFSIIDYVGGLADVEAKLIRTIGDPESRMVEDPVRMIRAVRFASTLGFAVDSGTREVILRQAELITRASPARMFEEVQKLFFCGHAREVLKQLHDYGLLCHMLPEVDAAMRGSEHDRHWLDRVTRQIDTWRSHQVKVTPALMFGLLFGLVHERAIARNLESGMNRFEAAEHAVRDHLVALASRVQIPKAIGMHLSQLMAVQPYFLNLNEKKATRFMQRPCFQDAFIYFKMRSRFEHAHDEAIHFWTDRIKARS
jgi:poly(A) polymerase